MMPIAQPHTLTDAQAERLLHDVVAISSPSHKEADAVRFW